VALDIKFVYLFSTFQDFFKNAIAAAGIFANKNPGQNQHNKQ